VKPGDTNRGGNQRRIEKLNTVCAMRETDLKRVCRFGLCLTIFFFVGWVVCGSFLPALAQSLPSEERTVEKGATCELDEQEFIVKGKNKAVLRVHRIFHIYNHRGKEHGRVSQHVNKFASVDNIKAQLMDFDGGLIKKLNKRDIIEESPFAHYTLYTDSRLKHFDLSTTTFPYTLEYSYEIKYNSLFFWPDWLPQSEIPVKRSVYTLTLPKDFAFKMYERNMEIEPIQKQSKGKRQLLFELADVPPFESEKNMPPEMDHRMSVLFAPEEFELAGYPGSTNSWQAFGEWYASLAHKQYELSRQPCSTIADVVKNCASTKEKVRTLYQFLQRKTRYVSIDLGIGGWKPRHAESVLATSYGDCKDLTTLFIAMLNATGIQAYPALIKTRDEGTVLTDFPSNQFNHVIACVPLEKDTLWLDCTCNYCSFGELPWQDEGCQTLVVMEHTGALAKTPTSSAEKNRITRSIQAKLELDGSLEIKGTITATGNYESSYREFLNSLTAIDKREWLGGLISKHAPSYTLLDYDFENIPNLGVPLTISFAAKLMKYPTLSADELLLNLNPLTRVDAQDVPKEKKRQYPVDNQYASTQEDEITLDLPEGFGIRALPDEQDMVLPFGSFQTRYQVDKSQLSYRRVHKVTQRLIQLEDFEEYKAFVDRIYAADRSFVVLKKNK